MVRGVEVELDNGRRVGQHAIDDAGWRRQLMELDSACVTNVQYLVTQRYEHVRDDAGEPLTGAEIADAKDRMN
jgi:hypothetical protein